jgi:hypothetical protein
MIAPVSVLLAQDKSPANKVAVVPLKLADKYGATIALLLMTGLATVPATAGAVNVTLPLVEPASDKIPLPVPAKPIVRVLVAKVRLVFVAGAVPEPPPNTTPPEASNAEDAHVVAEEKYGMPPDVPATVNAGVLVGVATEIKPPVKPTLVTVPPVAGDAQTVLPEPLIDNT